MSLLGRIEKNFLYDFRSRAYQTHFTSKHVYKLRKFIELELPENCSYPSDARIVRGARGAPNTIRIRDHGPEFKDSEWFSKPSRPQAAIEHRPRSLAFNKNGE